MIEGQRLIDQIHECFPVPLSQLPPDLQQFVSSAIEDARQGRLEAIQGLRAAIDEMTEEAETDGNIFEEDVLPPAQPLTSPAAASQLNALSELDDESEFRESLRSILKIDPHSVETMLMLADVADSIDERVEWFQRASAAVSHRDRVVVSRVMPYYRIDMASRLISDGRYADAVDIATPSLKEDSEDPAGIRDLLVEVYLRLNWEEELEKLIDQFADERDGVMSYASALLVYQREGASETASQLLSLAHAATPGVAERLTGVLPVEWMYQSPDHAESARVASILMPGVREMKGAVNWIRETLPDAIQKARELMSVSSWESDAAHDILEVAQALPAMDMSWQIHVNRVTQPRKAFLVSFFDDDDELIHFDVLDERPKRKELQRILLDAVTAPLVGNRSKPSMLFVGTKEDHRLLAKQADEIGIACEHRSPSVHLKAVVKQTSAMLVSQYDEAMKHDAASPSSHLPTPESAELSWQEFIEKTNAMPALETTWAIGVFQPPIFITDQATPWRAWLVMLVDTESGIILNVSIQQNEPTTGQLLNILAEAIVSPKMGEPGRPVGVVLEPSVSLLNPTGSVQPAIEFFVGEDVTANGFTAIISEMLAKQSPLPSSLRDLPGIDADFLQEFYKVAATFFRSRPWRMVGGDRLFNVSCSQWTPQTWSVCVMGQLGQQRGINVFDNPAGAARFIDSDGMEGSLAAVAVQFDEPHEGNPVDIWHIERSGWEVAASDAYPFVARIESGERFIPATSVDLRVLREVMRHTTQFLDTPPDQPFVVGEGKSSIEFQWVL